MKREVQRIEPWSMVRVGFFVGLLSGFVLGLIESLLLKSLVGSGQSSALPPGASELISLTGGGILLLAITMSLFGSLSFALCGALGAVFYNWAARLFGGVEMTTNDTAAPQDEASNSDPEDRDV
jgi:hypothetical protein